jgi:APA family basic amino acid/polyamine antiporter
MRSRKMNIVKNIFKTKSRYLKVIVDENIENEKKLERNLSLFDLICIGIGGTVGSGVFVLSPIIAHDYAGPSIIWSWLIAGIACLCSACAYAELSGRYPQSGSAYVYANVALGELPAVIAGWCLSLEYGISGAAVARSWGDKLIAWIESLGYEVPLIFNPGYNINIIAALLQLSCMFLLLKGLNIGKLTVNIFTLAKVVVVFFIIIVGLSLYNPSNVTHWNPYGVSGILKGSTSCFFGYIGFDEVCCLAAEAKNPNKNLPRAVFGTVISVTLFYCLSGLALVGMQDYTTISTSGGFAASFKYNNIDWAGNFVAAGELITLRKNNIYIFIYYISMIINY